MIKAQNNEYKKNLNEVKNFIEELKMKDHLSTHTLDAYYKDLEIFFSFIPNKLFTDISEGDILEYVKNMREENLARFLEVKDLAVEFHIPEGVLKAPDGVSFCVNPQEILGCQGQLCTQMGFCDWY